MEDQTTEIDKIVKPIIFAQDLDDLHISITNLLDMAEGDELDMILEHPTKSQKTKEAFLHKLVDSLTSPPLKSYFAELLIGCKKQSSYKAFTKRDITPFLNELKKVAEDTRVVNITVACDFKEEDIREMAQILADKLNHQVIFDMKINKALIAGAVIQLGNYITDYSVKSRMDQFTEAWEDSVVEDGAKVADISITKQ